MKRLYILSALVSVSLLGGKLEAQRLSLQEARAIALEQNKRLEQSDATEQKARYTLSAMKTNYLPKLSASAYGYWTTESKVRHLQLGSVETSKLLPASSTLQGLAMQYPNLAPIIGQVGQLLSGLPSQLTLPALPLRLSFGNSYMVGAHLDQPIYMGGKIRAGHRMAQIGLEMAGDSRRLTQEQVLLSVDEAYWLLAQAMELQKTAERFAQTIESAAQDVFNAVKAGMRTEADILRVRIEQDRAKLQLLQASNGIALAKMNLNQVLGRALSSEVEVEDLPDVGAFAPSNLVGDVSQRPEYALLSRQINLKEQEIKVIKSDFLPHLGLRASYSYVRAGKLNGVQLLDNHQPSVMLSLNVPIFSWGEGRNKIRAKRAEQKIASLELAEMSEKILLEQKQAEQRYHEELLSVQLTRSTIASAEEHLKIVRNRHRAGMETTTILLEAETLLSKAESDHVQARCRLALAHTALQKALGVLGR